MVSLYSTIKMMHGPINIRCSNSIVKGKAKAVPLQTQKGPEGSRKLRLPDFFNNGTGWW